MRLGSSPRLRAMKVKFCSVFTFGPPPISKIGELKFDPFRKELQWTALLEKTGVYGGEEFFARVGDFPTSQEAEKALRATEERRAKRQANAWTVNDAFKESHYEQ